MLTTYGVLAGMGNYGRKKRLKLQNYDELNLMCIKLSPEEGVVMEVVVKIYLVSPGPARDHYAFWGRLDVSHVVKTHSAHIERTITRVGGLCEEK